MPLPSPEFPLDRPIPADFAAALRGMADKPFLASQRWQEQQWRANREGAHPIILEFEPLLIRRMARLGVPMFAHCMIRTEAEQRQLFLDGHSRDSPDDGLWPHKAWAVDIVHSVHGWNLDRKAWALVGHVGKELAAQRGLKVVWGGDWKFYDPAHWEVAHDDR